MTDETNEGTAYLRALKQSTGQPGGAATAPAREVTPFDQPITAGTPAPGSEQFQGTEKRRSPRYKCEGSAELREEGHDVRTWASFTDISLHGCYVDAQATYPPGTALRLKLEANGIRVETKGTVRVTYPYLGMGIAFEHVDENSRTNLKQLLATLSRRCAIMGPGIASTLPANGLLDAVPTVSDPIAAIQALIEFFEDRQMLMREDFLRILKKSQK